ncbi:hypothetical protein FRB90_002927 [Tulasnella sp. 427]|nr:hypothetical protein FRB90_002927 [Tulasnella sp. 427]
MTPAPSQDKRLIISGLTPAISVQDIKSRFASFGTVKAVDGVGLLDGNGDPRKFAFVTVETNEQELAKCMNRLNGTKWKGAKLRIGEAKPDFGAITAAHDTDQIKSIKASLKRKERRAKSNGTSRRHAADMSLITPENVDHRKVRTILSSHILQKAYRVVQHWKQTPEGHIVRPLRMRPDRPIPSVAQKIPLSSKSGSKQPTATSRAVKTLQRTKLTVIDPTRYVSSHIMTFDSAAALGPDEQEADGEESENGSERSSENEVEVVDSDSNEESPGSSDEHDKDIKPTSLHHEPSQSTQPVSKQLESLPLSVQDEEIAHTREEKKRDLDILASLLGNQETLAWEPDSDLEQLAWENSDKRRRELEEEEESDDSSIDAAYAQGEAFLLQEAEEGQVKTAPLKEMFAPRPDESGFTLFDNIANIDLELEEPDIELEAKSTHREKERGEPFQQPHHESVTDLPLDRSAPFFFPLPRDKHGFVDTSFGLLPRQSSNQALEDAFGSANSIGAIEFWRTETDADIRKYWEETKGELTREYKQRHREALRRLKPVKGGPTSAE